MLSWIFKEEVDPDGLFYERLIAFALRAIP